MPLFQRCLHLPIPPDAAFIHPKTGAHAGVLIWTDVFGLRPSMRDIGKRIAAEGYSVLVPNPYFQAGVGGRSFRKAPMLPAEAVSRDSRQPTCSLN